ncbi:hypothetical protein [Urbifossiella limnaea]|uniref:Uncharacterized protein n=1 Tax=Urbifossiella limnaea TaxID=2528023 RepID=A0A517XNL4_9BACT|nr:hypothetical protein [Urbifossiella limnaea]QDU19105.1 hypothetical protein ETAA1_10090 [Urbifossiella limnaea]
MRWSKPAAVLCVAYSLVVAGCRDAGKDQPTAQPPAPSVGPDGQPFAATAPADSGSPAHAAAQQFVTDLRGSAATDPNRVSARFLKVIGKPLGTSPEDQAKKFSGAAAGQWLKRVAAAMGSDARVSPAAGAAREGSAVFVGSFESGAVPKGRYLIRLVEDGGAWKLDWFQVSAAEARVPTTPIDPFVDFAVLSLGDVLAAGPMTADDRAPLGAALFTPAVMAGWEVSQPEDAAGYDYQRGALAAKLDAVAAGKAEWYFRSSASVAAYKIQFGVGAEAMVFVDFALVRGDGPNHWRVDQFVRH